MVDNMPDVTYCQRIYFIFCVIDEMTIDCNLMKLYGYLNFKTPAWNLLEDILKNQKPIDEQIQSTEQELVPLDEKWKALQARIKQLKEQKQSIAEKQLSFDRLFEPNVTNDKNEEQKIAPFRSLFPWTGRCLSKAFRKQAYRQKWLPAGMPE